MPTASPSATLSASSSANLQSPHKKFSTITGLNPGGSNKSNGTNGRTSVKGLFGEDSTNETLNGGGSSIKSNGGSGFTANGSISRGSPHFNNSNNNNNNSSDGPWSISVAQVESQSTNPNPTSSFGTKKSRRASKINETESSSYTLYFTTPTHNLTLLRNGLEIIELDQKLREGQSNVNGLPKLPKLVTSNPSSSSTTTTGGRRLFQTISRTLSPGGSSKNRSALSNLSSSGMGGLAQVDQNVIQTDSSPSNGTSTPTSGKVSSPLPSTDAPSSNHNTTTHLATYLTTISNIPFIKKHKAWRRFIHVRSEDLQSVRVERRVRKVRSDLAQHVGSSVAPTNTNVGPSHSDLDEDGDGDEGASLSGRSNTNQSQGGGGGGASTTNTTTTAAGIKRTNTMRSDNTTASSSNNHNHSNRPEVPQRSTSVDQSQSESLSPNNLSTGAGGGGSNPSSARNSRSIVNGIPEGQENDGDTEMKDVTDATTTNGDSKNSSSTKQEKLKDQSNRRERSERKRRDKESDKVTVDDFEMIRVLGKGCAGKVSSLFGFQRKGRD